VSGITDSRALRKRPRWSPYPLERHAITSIQSLVKNLYCGWFRFRLAGAAVAFGR
jgi:hypothetical protein